MADKFRYNNRSVLVSRRMRALFNKINREVSQRDKKDIAHTTQDILTAFRELFSNIGRPTVELNPFEAKQVPRSRQINKTMAQIEEDLQTAYDEIGSLQDGLVESFNHAQELSADLVYSADKIGGKVVDLRLLEGQLDQDLIVAGDNFRTLEKVDTRIGLQNQSADILLDQGVLVLKRTAAKNLVNTNTQIDVTPVAPQGLATQPTVNNVNRFYEGKFYDFVGQSRPEGGRYHLEQTLSVNVEPTGLSASTIVINSPSPGNAIQTAQDRINQTETGPEPGEQLRPEDIIVFDRGASEQDKQIVRNYMIDENPATFWEAEYVKTDAEIQGLVEDSRLVGLDAESSIVNPDGTIDDGVISTVTLDDLRNEARASSSSEADDLIVDITVTLDKEADVNWLSLIPNNFEETAWIDVLDIQYAPAATDSYQRIPGFSDSIHDNIITDEANAELTDEEAGALLSPSKYAYRGIGVWSFEPVVAKSIRFRIRQRTASPTPYQRLAVRLHRVFTQVYTETNAETPGI